MCSLHSRPQNTPLSLRHTHEHRHSCIHSSPVELRKHNHTCPQPTVSCVHINTTQTTDIREHSHPLTPTNTHCHSCTCEHTVACAPMNMYSSCPHEHTFSCAYKLFLHLCPCWQQQSGRTWQNTHTPSPRVHSIAGLLLPRDGCHVERPITLSCIFYSLKQISIRSGLSRGCALWQTVWPV